MQIDLPVPLFPFRCPLQSNSSGRKYSAMFKQHKIRKCFVLLCPLNSMKNKISNNRKKVTDQEHINQFGIKQCFVLIDKPRKEPTEKSELLMFAKPPIERPRRGFTIHYAPEFLQDIANRFFSRNIGEECMNFTRIYNALKSPYWNLNCNQFISLLHTFYEEFCQKNKLEHNNIRIIIDVNNARVPQEVLEEIAIPKAKLKHCKKTTQVSLKGREKRPRNLNYQKTQLIEEIAESPDKKEMQVLSSTSGPAPEMLQEQQGGIDVHQHLLEIKIKAPVLKVLPEQIETDDPLLELEGREPVVRILQEQTSQKSVKAVQSLSEIKEKESAMEILIDQPSKECVKVDNPLPETEVKEPAVEILQELTPLENIIVDQLLPEVTEKEPVLEMLQELVREDNPLPEAEVREPTMEILQVQLSQENLKADQPLPELTGKEPPLELSQKLLREEIEDQSFSQIERKPALKLFQEQSVQESMKVLSLPKIEKKKPGLEMLQGQLLLEKAKADQHLLARTEDPPVLELMETRERKRKYSSESPTLRKKQMLREVVQNPEVMEKKQLADPIEDKPLIVESRPRKFARMQKQQELERMGIPPILHQLEDLDLIRKPQFLHPPCLQRQTVHPNFVSRMTIQYPGPVRYEVVNAVPSHNDSSNRTNLNDLDEKNIKNHNDTSDSMEKPNKMNGHYSDSDHIQMSDQVEVPDTVGENMRNRERRNSIIKSAEAEQSRRSSVIKQTVNSNNT